MYQMANDITYIVSQKVYMELNLQFFADGPGGEKTEEATAKKLSDARKEGQVAKSKEIASALSLLSLFVILKIWTGTLSEQIMELFSMVYGRFTEYISMPGGIIPVNDFSSLIINGMLRVLIMILPFFAIGFGVAFVSDLVQVKWEPTTKTLKPKLSKLNPVSGFKKMFNIQSLVELLKSIVKIIITVVIVYNELKKSYGLLLLLYDIPLIEAIIQTGNLIINIGLKISAVFMVVAAADFIFQKWKFRQDMKMTKQEVKEEYKSTEGDPQIKGKIRRKMQEASQRRMMSNLPKADVVITNPTHYAVAIVYDKDMGEAPVVLAKGADYVAQRIKEVAKEHNVSIVENKPLARSLYANVEIGQQVPPELYVAVAEVLAAVYKATGRV